MNAKAHAVAASLAIGGFVAHEEYQTGKNSLKPFVGASLTAWATKLPDILEPANYPNHRQFFHNLVFTAGLVRSLAELNSWQAKTDLDKASFPCS